MSKTSQNEHKTKSNSIESGSSDSSDIYRVLDAASASSLSDYFNLNNLTNIGKMILEKLVYYPSHLIAVFALLVLLVIFLRPNAFAKNQAKSQPRLVLNCSDDNRFMQIVDIYSQTTDQLLVSDCSTHLKNINDYCKDNQKCVQHRIDYILIESCDNMSKNATNISYECLGFKKLASVDVWHNYQTMFVLEQPSKYVMFAKPTYFSCLKECNLTNECKYFSLDNHSCLIYPQKIDSYFKFSNKNEHSSKYFLFMRLESHDLESKKSMYASEKSIDGLQNHWPIQSTNYLLKDTLGGIEFQSLKARTLKYVMNRYSESFSAVKLSGSNLWIEKKFSFNGTGGGFTFSSWAIFTKDVNCLLDFDNDYDHSPDFLRFCFFKKLFYSHFALENQSHAKFLYSDLEINLNQWLHYAVTLNGTVASVHFNGILFWKTDLTARVKHVVLSRIFMGRSLEKNELSDVIFDDVKIFHRALTSEEISNDMQGMYNRYELVGEKLNKPRSFNPELLIDYWPIERNRTENLVGQKKIFIQQDSDFISDRFGRPFSALRVWASAKLSFGETYLDGDFKREFTLTVWTLFRGSRQAKFEYDAKNVFFFFKNSVFIICAYTDSEHMNAINELEPNRWYHYAFSFDKQFRRMYLNGIFLNEIVVNLDFEEQSRITKKFECNADIDEVKFFQKALDQKEITNDMIGLHSKDFD